MICKCLFFSIDWSRIRGFLQKARNDIIITVLRLNIVTCNHFNNNMKDAELLILFLTYLNPQRFLLCTS